MRIKSFTFNPFQENTFIIYDDTKECIIIDPGFYEENEKNEFISFINKNNLTPTKLINTHCHIDHILGNDFVTKEWNLNINIHEKESEILEKSKEVATMYGFNRYIYPNQEVSFISEKNKIRFGSTKLNILFVPGHSPGHICLYNKKEKSLISGDVVFQGSIGRTDLPGGNYDMLMHSIVKKILPLPHEVQIYPGHGPVTNLGFEKEHNPFLQ